MISTPCGRRNCDRLASYTCYSTPLCSDHAAAICATDPVTPIVAGLVEEEPVAA